MTWSKQSYSHPRTALKRSWDSNRTTLTRVSSEISRCTLSTGRYHTPNTEAVDPIAVIGTWAYAGTNQVQEVAIVVIVRSRRPIVAVGPSIDRRRGTEVAGVEEVIWISP